MSTPLRISPRDLSSHQFQGLVEHSHTILACTSCEEELLDVMVVNPELPVDLVYQATCHFCGGSSFATEVHGHTCIGVIGETIFTDTHLLEDRVLFVTARKGGSQ